MMSVSKFWFFTKFYQEDTIQSKVRWEMRP